MVHLDLHSEYSLIDGLIRLEDLMAEVPKRGMKAVAITDFCNLFAVVKFYKSALATGIKPIIGSDILCIDPTYDKEGSPLKLLCQNNVGYRHLTQLISRA